MNESSFQNLIGVLPDPLAAERFLGQFRERNSFQTAKLIKDQGLLSDVLTLASFSPLFATTLLQNPEYVLWLGRKRKDSQVYREVEISLPNELTDEQNMAWTRQFVGDIYVKRGMVAVLNFHGKINEASEIYQPHCHIVLTTRHLLEKGFGLKNRDWNQQSLLQEAREQYEAYQNAALKEHEFEVRVDH